MARCSHGVAALLASVALLAAPARCLAALTFESETGVSSGTWNGITFPAASATSPGPSPLLAGSFPRRRSTYVGGPGESLVPPYARGSISLLSSCAYRIRVSLLVLQHL